MSFPINPPTKAIVDLRNGYPTPEFYRFLANLWRVVGVPENPTDESALLGMTAAFAPEPPAPVYLLSVVEPGTLTAGNGVTGGGNMANNVTITVEAGTGITVNANDVALDTASTRNTDHASVTITAGAGLTGGGTIEATRTLDVGAGTGLTVNANDVALDTSHVRNVDHSAVSITAGTGLSGGGTIEATRTINLANTTVVPGTYAPPASITVDAQGRITAIS